MSRVCLVGFPRASCVTLACSGTAEHDGGVDPLDKAVRQVRRVRMLHALLMAIGFGVLLVAALAQRH